jgi:hypothetical protein
MNKYLSFLICGILIFTFGYNLFQHALNIPSFDDYEATINFIRKFYFQTGSFPQKLSLLFSFHNDHCILISRASAALYYNLFKEVNFAHLIIYQNLFFVAFYVLLLVIMRQENLLSSYTVLIVTIFLFNLSLWQVIFNYWGGIQTYTVFFFSFLSLFLLNKTEKPQDKFFILAVVSILFAVSSFGNGVLALFLGTFLLSARKKRAALIVWSIISAGLLFFILFWRLKSHVPVQEIFNLNWMLRLLFTFSGSFIFVNPSQDFMHYANIILCMVVGAGVLAFWLGLIFKGYHLKNPLLYALLSLPILTGLLIAVSRFTTKAAGGVAPRYMFFTATIPILIILILIDLKIVSQKSLKFLTVFSFVIWSASFYNNRMALETYNKEMIAIIKKWEKDDQTRLIYYHEPSYYSRMMHWAIKEKVIHIPDEIQEK